MHVYVRMHTHIYMREFMCTSYVKMPTESEEQCQSPWNFNCRQVAIRSHPKWVLETEPRSHFFFLQWSRTSQVSPVSAPSYNGSTVVTDVCHGAQLSKSSGHSNSGPTFVQQVCSWHHLSNLEPQLSCEATLAPMLVSRAACLAPARGVPHNPPHVMADLC